VGKYLRHMPRIKQIRGSWLHRRVGDRLLDPNLWQPGRETIARGLAIGAFFSMLPMPLQSLPAVFVALLMRANVPAALVGCWITNPVTAAFFVLIQIQLGFFILGEGKAWDALKDRPVLDLLMHVPVPLLLGAVLLGLVLSAAAYGGALITYDWFSRRIARSAHRRRGGRFLRPNEDKTQ
jgi:uncharacterized protein (DUF2062 family)